MCKEASYAPPELFKYSESGKLMKWVIWVVNNTIYTEFGYEDGSRQLEKSTIYDGTNIGNINEKSPDDQAIFVANKKWKDKQTYNLYAESIEDALKIFNGVKLIGGTIKPMKAFKYADKKDTLIPSFYVQYKYDGLRTTAVCDYREVIHDELACSIKLYTSGGKEIIGFDRVKIALSSIMRKGDIIDGELYCHGMPLKDISGIVRRTKNIDIEDQHKLTYIMFDVPKIQHLSFQASYYERMSLLKQMYDSQPIPYKERVSIAPTFKVSSHSMADELYGRAILDGYEGIMYRVINSPYEQKRSNFILKRKEFYDAEFEIVSVNEGSGRDEGTAGSFTCITPNGRTFNCRIKGTYEYRRQLFNNSRLWKGKQLTVRYLQIWDGVPQIPVGINIRERFE